MLKIFFQSLAIIIELTSYRICCALLIATVILLLILEKLFRIHIIIRTDDNDDNDHSGKLFINPGRLAASLSTQRIDHSKTVTISIIWLLLPWRSISRLWGYFNQIPLPVFIRRPLYIWYSRIFGCNLDEIANKNLYEYRNLSEFFRRQLMPSLRPIDRQASIVSPADGTVVQFEMVPIDGGFIGNVKGIHYSIENFLGPNNLNYSGFNRNWSLRPEKIQTNKRLYACVVYLAPGDYHRFHSPTDWIINRRRHFSGHLLSVRPSFVQRISNLFAINERVVYFGHWKFGFFAMAAVGATNVGSINVFVDPVSFHLPIIYTVINNHQTCFQSIRNYKQIVFKWKQRYIVKKNCLKNPFHNEKVNFLVNLISDQPWLSYLKHLPPVLMM